MKTTFKLFLLLFSTTLLFSACAGGDTNKRNANFLPPLQITIADEIKGNTELVDVVKSSEKAINEFSDNIEQLALDGKDLLQKSKNDEEAGMMDKIKAGKLMVQFASNSTQMLAAMQKFTEYVETQKANGTVSDEQLKALEQVGKAFQKRMDELDKKYKGYFDK